MTTESWLKIKNAMTQAGIGKYQIDTDTDYHLFNDPDNAKVIVLDEGTSTFFNFRQRVANGADGWQDPIIVTSVTVEDAHMVKFGAGPEKIRQFIEAMGLNLSDEEMKAVIKINRGNYDINPITGDYLLAGFKVLTEEEIEELSPQEKIDYEKKKELYDKRQKFTGQNHVVEITY